MKVRCIKSLPPILSGDTYNVDSIYISDTHLPDTKEVLMLMYTIIEPDGDLCGLPAGNFEIISGLNEFDKLFKGFSY